MSVACKLTGIITLTIKNTLQTLIRKSCMKKDLKKRIDEHNRKVDCLIKYRKDDSKRIIVATLGTVTTAPIYKE
jgi:DNA polymerase elongation subunit (family B)